MIVAHNVYDDTLGNTFKGLVLYAVWLGERLFCVTKGHFNALVIAQDIGGSITRIDGEELMRLWLYTNK